MNWVLIVIIAFNAPTITAVEFSSKEQCGAALEALKKNALVGMRIGGICVRKT